MGQSRSHCLLYFQSNSKSKAMRRYAVTLDGSASAAQQQLTTSIIDGTGFVFAGNCSLHIWQAVTTAEHHALHLSTMTS